MDMAAWRRVVLVFWLLFPLCFPGESYGQAAQQRAPGDKAKGDIPTEKNPVVPLPDGNVAVNQMNEKYIQVWRTLMAPKNVADAFGRRIAQRYIAMQVTVANRNLDYQWLIQDASIDLSRLVTRLSDQTNCQPNLKQLAAALGKLGLRRIATETVVDKKIEIETFEANGLSNPFLTSAELTVLRGVAEKGQALDRRNLILRVLQGVGTVGAGLLGVTTFGPSFAPAVAAFNGPLISAYQTTFPDFTINQMNRLNDSAFLANTLVGKQQARVIVLFMPVQYLLTDQQAKQFYDDPESVFSCPDLRLLEANVNGNFISSVIPTPVITTIAVDPNEQAKFAEDNFTVNGVIVGRFLDKATVALVTPPKGVTVQAGADPSDQRLPFVLQGKEPLTPGTVLEFEVSREGVDPAKGTLTVLYQPAAPVFAAGALKPSEIMQGTTAVVTVTGSNFLPKGMEAVIEGTGITVGPVTYRSSTEVEIEVSVSETAALGERRFRVSSAGGLTNPATMLTITEKP